MDVDAVFAGADLCERPGFLDNVVQILRATLRFALRDEFTQTTDNISRTGGLAGRLFQRVRHARAGVSPSLRVNCRAACK